VNSAGLVNEYGNPLRLRKALDAGCKVIAAHLATEGTAIDLDRAHGGCLPPREENFKVSRGLFALNLAFSLLFFLYFLY
jgi:mannonate dehydratase